MKTALVRDENGMKIIRDDYYSTNKELEEDLRGNGYKVLKVWNGSKTDKEVHAWDFSNRVNGG